MESKGTIFVTNHLSKSMWTGANDHLSLLVGSYFRRLVAQHIDLLQHSCQVWGHLSSCVIVFECTVY